MANRGSRQPSPWVSCQRAKRKAKEMDAIAAAEAATQCARSPRDLHRTRHARARPAVFVQVSRFPVRWRSRGHKARTWPAVHLPKAMLALGLSLGIDGLYASPGLSCEPGGARRMKSVAQQYSGSGTGRNPWFHPDSLRRMVGEASLLAANGANPCTPTQAVNGRSGAGSRVVFVCLLPRFQPRRGLSGAGKLLVPFIACAANTPQHQITISQRRAISMPFSSSHN